MSLYSNQIIEDEENCINSILERGLEEMKISQGSSLLNNNRSYQTQSHNQNAQKVKSPPISTSTSNNLYNIMSTSEIPNNNNNSNTMYSTSHALKNIMSKIESNNANLGDVNELSKDDNEQITEISKKLKPSNAQQLKEMHSRLENLQNRIKGLDKRITDSNQNLEKFYSFMTPKQKSKTIKTQRSSSSTSSNKQNKRRRSQSSNKSKKGKGKVKNAEKISEEIWKERYIKIKNDLLEDKNTLIKLRQEKNDLNKKYLKMSKKEKQYDELFEVNEKIMESNETLLAQLEESEDVRIEQEKLIISLQKEVQRLRGNFENSRLVNQNSNQKKFKSN